MARSHPAAANPDHLAARLALLEREKDLNRERDALATARRALPPVEVTKDYSSRPRAGPPRWPIFSLGMGSL